MANQEAIHENFIVKDDDRDRAIDDRGEHDEQLNIGEALRDEHLGQEAKEEIGKPVDLWDHKWKWNESYTEWNDNECLTLQLKEEEKNRNKWKAAARKVKGI